MLRIVAVQFVAEVLPIFRVLPLEAVDFTYGKLPLCREWHFVAVNCCPQIMPILWVDWIWAEQLLIIAMPILTES